ncbi:anthranilate synthase component I [Chloroflexota bacterium]
MYYPDVEQVKKLKVKGNLVPVYREIIADMETPVSAFLKVKGAGFAFLLESVEGGQRMARYSVIGVDPYETLSVNTHDDVDTFKAVAERMRQYRVVVVEGLPRFSGGAVGYFAYETINRIEDLPSPEADRLELPEAVFMFVDTLLVFDHVMHKIKVISHVKLDGDIEKSYREAVAKIDRLIMRLETPLAGRKNLGGSLENYETSPITSNFTAEAFGTAIDKIKQYITEGEAIQVVLSQRLCQPTAAEPFNVYRALRSINPSPYMFFLDFNDYQIVGTSPEILVRVEDGLVMTRPLAGTRPRGSDSAEDTALERELVADEKERAEHVMLVDLGRNDIGRVAEPGSVVVSELMNVERYSHVMHMVTNVQGKLEEGLTAFDAMRACFPAGTVSGAPKIRAMEIIAELEPEKRGPYAGAVGYFSFTGNMDMAIAIRTMILKGGKAYVQAGCGVVHDSVSEKEYEETMNKARALLKAIGQAEGREAPRAAAY